MSIITAVKKIFSGEKSEEAPIQIEIGKPTLEKKFGDFILFSGRIDEFNSFYKLGGPFRRNGISRAKWAKKVQLSSYNWPAFSKVEEDFEKRIDKILSMVSPVGDKFLVLKILGPTELAESFCADKVPAKYYNRGDIYHQFNFSYLATFEFEKAEELHNKITDYIVDILENFEHITLFNAVRIADDIFSYKGGLYPLEFLSKVWVKNHTRITRAIKKSGLTPILHSDGDITPMIKVINRIYRGLHPLDLTYKNSENELSQWLSKILKLREKCELVFFTGIPINLLYGNEQDFMLLKRFIPKLREKLLNKRFIFSTTHRPYANIDVYSSEIQKRIQDVVDIIKEEKIT